MPVVLTTGYSDALARGDHAFPVLHKPYSLEALASAIGQAVER
jgi:DNA-binding LytR/AlgR family response regulator